MRSPTPLTPNARRILKEFAVNVLHDPTIELPLSLARNLWGRGALAHSLPASVKRGYLTYNEGVFHITEEGLREAQRDE
jgi:hypothetical protein